MSDAQVEMQFLIREYDPSDCEQIAQLFYQTVHSVNADDYTREQLDAWASGCVDLTEWNASFLRHFTVVAVKGRWWLASGTWILPDIWIDYTFTKTIKIRELPPQSVMYWNRRLMPILSRLMLPLLQKGSLRTEDITWLRNSRLSEKAFL